MMNQTLAIFADAYRELNHKKLFWITLGLSGALMAIFALFGVSDDYVTFLWYHWTNVFGLTPAGAYRVIFSLAAIGFWLTWGATFLALVSTSGIFPDFLTAGSIDLYLCKPIGRLRLFLTKYFAGLLFVALQVTAFSVVSFLVMGFRGGIWAPSIFLAIPIVTVYFSYLFSIQVFVGVWTRSTIASFLVTALCFLLFFGVHWIESRLLMLETTLHSQTTFLDGRLKSVEGRIAALDTRPAGSTEPASTRLETALRQREELRARRESVDTFLANIDFWHNILWGVKTVFPKTSETVNLLDLYLVQDDEVPAVVPRRGRFQTPPDPEDPANVEDRTAEARAAAVAVRHRSLGWVLGTSLLFEGVVVALAAWIFCRRDY